MFHTGYEFHITENVPYRFGGKICHTDLTGWTGVLKIFQSRKVSDDRLRTTTDTV